MGKASNIVKERVCSICKRELRTDSKGLKDHFGLCARAARAGLVLPGVIVKPKVELIVP